MSAEHVVMFSGGLGSWAAAKLVAREHGTDRLTLLFADVRGDSTREHVGEDEDTYRFIAEAAANVGGQFVRVADGRDIWQVFADDRFLGNSRLANCSKYLKQIPARRWLDANREPADTCVYVGIDWTEAHRLPAIVNAYQPYALKAPLCDAPALDSRAWAEAEGLTIPRLYLAGFPHNNCGGGCVRSGQAQFALLLREYPERYRAWEAREQELRHDLGKDVAILRDRTRGQVVPLTLRKFRDGIESQSTMFDEHDFGGCGCFASYDDAPLTSEGTP